MLLWSEMTIHVSPPYAQNQMQTMQGFVEANIDLWIWGLEGN
jgi:hypothetical protein